MLRVCLLAHHAASVLRLCSECLFHLSSVETAFVSYYLSCLAEVGVFQWTFSVLGNPVVENDDCFHTDDCFALLNCSFPESAFLCRPRPCSVRCIALCTLWEFNRPGCSRLRNCNCLLTIVYILSFRRNRVRKEHNQVQTYKAKIVSEI